ncbi:hypothetical protein HELRODRAFT_135400, partial [Helobdella robusta]|uniref:protein-tyrosine-phosphatase n=1 Tax=Helobdella robusta TaxID=6412 RepID=T1EI87_HELRO
LLIGQYDDQVSKCAIIDCRYPYEYHGGHIKVSFCLLFVCSFDSRKSVLIFHCEFSSERGPRLLQHLRSRDREAHIMTYPQLYYPEIYLLDGGYKAFYEAYPHLCEPQRYKPMDHADHAHELRHFKNKSKSWSAGDKA